MQNFFGKQLKIACVLSLIVSMGVFYYPMKSPSHDYDSFSEWVKTQLSEDSCDNSSEQTVNNRFAANADFVKHVRKVIDENRVEETHLSNDTLRYLFMAWTNFYAGSDMGSTALLDRFVNYQFYLNPHLNAGGTPAALFSNKKQYLSPIISSATDFSAFISHLMRPASSGISINAP